jgi:hypothetical protein
MRTTTSAPFKADLQSSRPIPMDGTSPAPLSAPSSSSRSAPEDEQLELSRDKGLRGSLEAEPEPEPEPNLDGVSRMSKRSISLDAGLAQLAAGGAIAIDNADDHAGVEAVTTAADAGGGGGGGEAAAVQQHLGDDEAPRSRATTASVQFAPDVTSQPAVVASVDGSGSSSSSSSDPQLAETTQLLATARGVRSVTAINRTLPGQDQHPGGGDDDGVVTGARSGVTAMAARAQRLTRVSERGRAQRPVYMDDTVSGRFHILCGRFDRDFPTCCVFLSHMLRVLEMTKWKRPGQMLAERATYYAAASGGGSAPKVAGGGSGGAAGLARHTEAEAAAEAEGAGGEAVPMPAHPLMVIGGLEPQERRALLTSRVDAFHAERVFVAQAWVHHALVVRSPRSWRDATTDRRLLPRHLPPCAGRECRAR